MLNLAPGIGYLLPSNPQLVVTMPSAKSPIISDDALNKLWIGLVSVEFALVIGVLVLALWARVRPRRQGYSPI
ncbi:hypothetical protein M0657_003622 [Pyricularia oryzae]|nr:hypothetical protein M0657_003622 [Pyricularia oryzae]KAI7929431.1 hypothetical protein M9X92_001319 [Pyricularia oryzae]